MKQADEEFVEFARQRASQLGETLGLEHKKWLSLEDPLHQAHLLRACFALRNHGGGWLVIGVDDGTGLRSPGAPTDLRASYNADKIQRMVADFSTDPFEVAIAYPEIAGGPVVVLRIAPGVKTPVISRKGIPNSKLEADTIYCRSIHGGQVSSVPAGHKDFQTILETCLRNREGNIGEFVRRHWADLVNEVARLPESRGRILDQAFGAGDVCFSMALNEKGLNQIPRSGFFSVCATWDGELPNTSASIGLFTRMLMAHPQVSGWPPWMDPASFPGEPNGRWVRDTAWEGIIAIMAPSVYGPVFNHLDFSRWDPGQSLFYRTPIIDDLAWASQFYVEQQTETTTGPRPPWIGKTLNRGQAMLQVAESMYTAQCLVRAAFELQDADVPEHLLFRFMYTGLSGRYLSSRGRDFPLTSSRVARTDSKAADVQVRMDAGRTAINELTCQVLAPVFSLFGGEELKPEDVDSTLREFWAKV
jgi:hypothetical protein